jgi:diguanylate cyclase (GGDEF)-like protein
MAQEGLPDLILLDALMPGMDGFTVCERLKADPRTQEIPVLFLTALQGEVDEIRALSAGAIDFIQKPINAATVLARVRNHIELKRSKDRLQELAVQDGLTFLSNRRHFDQVLAREWQRSRREGSPLALILGDVDCFKNFNDAYGHVAGDACLKAVAGAFQGALRRPADLAARFGGEEFVCLLPDTDEAGARAVAEGITQAMAERALPHDHSHVAPHVTVSLGVAAVFPAMDEGAASLVAEADRRMYEAKRKAKARNPGA